MQITPNHPLQQTAGAKGFPRVSAAAAPAAAERELWAEVKMTGDSLGQEQAIAAAAALMSNSGYVYGPCLRATPVGIAGLGDWELEFAHVGCTGPSPTSDPPTMEITIAIDEGRARFLDQWWNRKSH